MRKIPETVDVKVSVKDVVYDTLFLMLYSSRTAQVRCFFCWPEASTWGWNTIISLLELFHWPDFLFHHQDNHAKRCSKELFPEQGCCASSTAANLFSSILTMIKVCVARLNSCLCGGKTFSKFSVGPALSIFEASNRISCLKCSFSCSPVCTSSWNIFNMPYFTVSLCPHIQL